MIIQRPELTRRIKELDKWIMVFGRRKTGKTFLLREFIPHDEYFFVKRDRSILTEDNGKMKNLVIDTFTEILQRELNNGKTIVVDEFHRLGDEFFDLLHSMEKSGKLILVSSTLSFSKKLLDKRSPLLGLFAEVPVPIIDLSNTLDALDSKHFNKKDTMELAITLREPITIDYLDSSNDARETLLKVLTSTLRTIPALVGEIFQEENRQLSNKYEGVLRAIATGNTSSGSIADYLFSNRLIDKNDPSLVQQYLANMVEFGVLKKTEIYNKRKKRYSHSSHLIHLYYYADEHYNISERHPLMEEMDRIVDDVMPHLVEDQIREHLAKKNGLTEGIIEKPEHDVDVCLLRFQKPQIIGEVKWKDEISQSDVQRAEEVLTQYEVDKRFLFVPDEEKVESDELEINDIEDLK
ncbi:MAG: ATP-binding protein [Candidatus Thermoplasmatota archaeon]|nr:ATP-binding protein [Candidatus Thermoplasmatota archaeon]